MSELPAALTERPIVLCGFMGSGKSSVGRRIAQAVGREFFDADEVIARREGRSISEIFATDGEASFRAIEAAVTAELVADRPAAVIALGGGALGSAATRALLLDAACLVHLDQPFEELEAALPELRAGRPVLGTRSVEEIRALYEERRALYLAAPLQVPLARRGVRDATDAVLDALGATPRPPAGGDR